MSHRIVTGLTLAACVLCAGAVQGETKNVLRFGACYVSPTGDVTEPFSFSGEDLGDGTMLAFDGVVTIEPQGAAGLTFGYEYRWRERIGFEVTLLNAKSDLDGRLRGTYWINDSTTGALISTGPLDETEKIGDVTLTPLTFGVDFHLTPGHRVDVYLAPAVGWVFYGDLDMVDEKASIKDDFTWGATVGVDWPVGRGRWSFGGAVRYLSTEAEPDEPGYSGEALEVDPLIVQAGAVYRF